MSCASGGTHRPPWLSDTAQHRCTCWCPDLHPETLGSSADGGLPGHLLPASASRAPADKESCWEHLAACRTWRFPLFCGDPLCHCVLTIFIFLGVASVATSLLLGFSGVAWLCICFRIRVLEKSELLACAAQERCLNPQELTALVRGRTWAQDGSCGPHSVQVIRFVFWAVVFLVSLVLSLPWFVQELWRDNRWIQQRAYF